MVETSAALIVFVILDIAVALVTIASVSSVAVAIVVPGIFSAFI
jgi:hypothetical protein